MKRLYVHVLEWPMGVLALDGFGGKVAYAQLLNDASEVKFSESVETGYLPGKSEGRASNTLILRLPVRQPDITVPVIELFLK
jgi:alpha-L-fucosidase